MKRLKILRKRKGLTQDNIAKIIGTTQSNYGKYELNQQEPDIGTLCRIADYYGVSLDYLCDHDTDTLLDVSGWNETQKSVVFALNKLTEKNQIIVLGYTLRVLAEQNQ
jgi:transcriptional regulator with XRE-family HTH domain